MTPERQPVNVGALIQQAAVAVGMQASTQFGAALAAAIDAQTAAAVQAAHAAHAEQRGPYPYDRARARR